MYKKIIYYQDYKGRKPVKEFIDNLDDKTEGKILATIAFLQLHWKEARRPLVDYIGDKLYELRVHFHSDKVRILYAYMFEDYIVLLHAVRKKTSKILEVDKLKAKKRRIDFEIRYKEGLIKLK